MRNYYRQTTSGDLQSDFRAYNKLIERILMMVFQELSQVGMESRFELTAIRNSVAIIRKTVDQSDVECEG